MLRQGFVLGPFAPDLDNTSVGKWQRAKLSICSMLCPQAASREKEAVAVSFAESLRVDANPIFDSIYQHPFVQGIAYGQLSREALIHYVQQDTEYLGTYCRVYGLALTKSHSRSQMVTFYNRIGMLLDGELTPHENFCRAAGVVHDELVRQPVQLAPSAHHYARHMMSVAQQGTLGEIVAVLLPCHWVYVDIARRIIRDVQPTQDHLFYDWIQFYASDDMVSSLTELTVLLDELASFAGELDLVMMKSAFLDSCRLEYQFFDMAYRREQWIASDPASKTIRSGRQAEATEVNPHG